MLYKGPNLKNKIIRIYQMKLGKKMFLVLLCFSTISTYYIFDLQGFGNFMERNFGNPQENQNYKFEGEHRDNHCGNEDVFGTAHHIIPRKILRSVLSFSFVCWYRFSPALHSFQRIISSLNQFLKLYHNDGEMREIDNEQAIDQLSTDMIWERSNLFCGPQENLRENQPKDGFDMDCVKLLKNPLKNERMKIISKFECLDYLHIIYNKLPDPANQELKKKFIEYIQQCASTSSTFISIKKEIEEVQKGKNNTELKKLIISEFKINKIIELFKSIKKLKPIKAVWTLSNGKYRVDSCDIDHQN